MSEVERLRGKIAELQVEADKHGTARQHHDSEARKVRREIAVLNEELVQALMRQVAKQAAPAAPTVPQEAPVPVEATKKRRR